MMKRLIIAICLSLLAVGAVEAQWLQLTGARRINIISLTTPSAMTVGDADQTITCTTLSGDACTVTANTCTSPTGTCCSIASGKLHADAAGTCTVTANDSGTGGYGAAQAVTSGNVTISAGGCSDHVVTLDGTTTSQRAITDGASGNMLATTWQTGQAGTLKSIEVYISNVVTTGGVMTGRYKNGTTAYSTDFTSVYDQSMTSAAVNATGWFMFTLSPALTVTATDHLSFGVHSNVYAGPYWAYHTVASGGNAWDDGSGASWSAWNNDTAKNHVMRYTICY